MNPQDLLKSQLQGEIKAIRQKLATKERLLEALLAAYPDEVGDRRRTITTLVVRSGGMAKVKELLEGCGEPLTTQQVVERLPAIPKNTIRFYLTRGLAKSLWRKVAGPGRVTRWTSTHQQEQAEGPQ